MKFNKLFICMVLLFITLNLFIINTLMYKNRIQNSCFRLHITANSNHKDDQIIKIKLLNYLENNYLNNIDQTKIKSFFEENNNIILKDINKFLKENNFNYKAKLKIGKNYFDKKESKTYNMPSGVYPSINIVLGKGYGKNLWTIIYSKNEEITNSFLPLSSQYNEDVTYSFYSLELLNKIAATI